VLNLPVMKLLRVLSLTLLATMASAQERPYVLKAQRLFDSVTGKLVSPGVVVVSGGKIQSVGAASTPAGATVVDLGDATLMPGFIDSHTHLTFDFDPDYDGSMLRDLQRTVAEKIDTLHRERTSHSDGRFHHGTKFGSQ